MISIIMAYYNNPGMLTRQIRHFWEMPQHVRDLMEYVVVDDGSQLPAINSFRDWSERFNFRWKLYRIDVDIRWNQDAARNIGAKHARFDWLFLTDMDHLIPTNTLQSLQVMHSSDRWDLSLKTAYRFTRVNDVTFEPYKFHPNSWLMHRSLYEKIGGYDERLAGCYGTDSDFRTRVKDAATIIQLELPLIRVGREHTPDASTPREYGRKSKENAEEMSRRLILRKKKNLPILNFTNPYHLVEEHSAY